MCVDCQRNRWLILMQSGFGELRQDEAKQVWLITVPKPECCWALPVPIAASGSGRAQHLSGSMHKAFVFFCLYSIWFLPFHNEHEEQTEVNCLGGSWLCLFLCSVFHLFVFGWLWNLKPKYDGNAFPGGGGRREQCTPSSGIAYNYRPEGRQERNVTGGGGLLQLLLWTR